MPIKLEITRLTPELSDAISPRDRMQINKVLNSLYDLVETLSRRAYEAQVLAEETAKQTSNLINDFAQPPVTGSPDPLIRSVGNISSNMTKVVGVFASDGYIVVKDTVGNTRKLLTTA